MVSFNPLIPPPTLLSPDLLQRLELIFIMYSSYFQYPKIFEHYQKILNIYIFIIYSYIFRSVPEKTILGLGVLTQQWVTYSANGYALSIERFRLISIKVLFETNYVFWNLLLWVCELKVNRLDLISLEDRSFPLWHHSLQEIVKLITCQS